MRQRQNRVLYRRSQNSAWTKHSKTLPPYWINQKTDQLFILSMDKQKTNSPLSAAITIDTSHELFIILILLKLADIKQAVGNKSQ